MEGLLLNSGSTIGQMKFLITSLQRPIMLKSNTLRLVFTASLFSFKRIMWSLHRMWQIAGQVAAWLEAHLRFPGNVSSPIVYKDEITIFERWKVPVICSKSKHGMLNLTELQLVTINRPDKLLYSNRQKRLQLLFMQRRYYDVITNQESEDHNTFRGLLKSVESKHCYSYYCFIAKRNLSLSSTLDEI